MRPITGVVINERQIEMKGGRIITIDHTFNLGANVLICFDFTNMEVESIKLARHTYPGASLLPRAEEVHDDDTPDEGLTHDYVDYLSRE